MKCQLCGLPGIVAVVWALRCGDEATEVLLLVAGLPWQVFRQEQEECRLILFEPLDTPTGRPGIAATTNAPPDLAKHDPS